MLCPVVSITGGSSPKDTKWPKIFRSEGCPGKMISFPGIICTVSSYAMEVYFGEFVIRYVKVEFRNAKKVPILGSN